MQVLEKVLNHSRMFRYQEDRVPIMIFMGLFAIDIFAFYSISNLWLLSLYSMIAFLPKSMITSWNHHHQHLHVFKKEPFNFLLELMYGFQTGVLASGWVLHHNLGHHRKYLNGYEDESRWVNKDNNQMSCFRYTVEISLLAYPLIVRNGWSLNRQELRRFLLGITCHGTIFACFAMINPSAAVIIFLLPSVAGLFATVWHTYQHHAGLYTTQHEEASWNVLDPVYNLLTGNLGYHSAHHISCGVHWSKLPDLHERIAHKIPSHLYREPGFPFPLFGFLLKPFFRPKPITRATR